MFTQGLHFEVWGLHFNTQGLHLEPQGLYFYTGAGIGALEAAR